MNSDRLRVLFCDHLSLARGKYLPANKIGDGSTRLCQGVYALTYAKDLIPAPGGALLEGLPDMVASFQATDVRDGWQARTSVVVADLYDTNGEPLDLCGRGLLKRTVDKWHDIGLTAKLGIELEAYAFEMDDAQGLRPYATPGGFVYSTGVLSDPRGFIDAIWDRALAAGFPVECITSEFDAPQFEFTLSYDDAVKAIDDAFLFRLMAREVAYEHGIVLTFMPSPIATLGGSGLHINFSFNDASGNNVLVEPGATYDLSDTARGCIAGLMHHHASMAGLIAPTVNSYQRLKPASLSGFWQNWGFDHRGVTIRVASEEGPRARIEHRMGDAAASPYVQAATVLQAALLGVQHAYPLAAPESQDCIVAQDAKESVPKNLSTALDALEKDESLIHALNATLVANHVAIKRAEIEEHRHLEGDAARDYYIHYV